MLDFHSHYADLNSIVNSDLLLPQNYSLDNQHKVLSSCSRHLGEIGLDKRYIDILSMDEQVQILEALLKICKEQNLSASLHCVGATQLMLNSIRKAQLPKWKLLWHGFNGSSETARQLYNLGVIISIGPRFNKDWHETVGANPFYVFESDYTGSSKTEHDAFFDSIISKACKELKVSLPELEEHCESIEKIFKN